VYAHIGPLDERFEIGLFEDDDYSMRARRAGYRVVCAEDVLVHHFGEASFGALVPTGEHARLFEANRQRFEEKWEMPWRRHGRRQTDEYRDTIQRIRETVSGSVPAGAQVLVVSRGDEELPQARWPAGRSLSPGCRRRLCGSSIQRTAVKQSPSWNNLDPPVLSSW